MDEEAGATEQDEGLLARGPQRSYIVKLLEIFTSEQEEEEQSETI